MKTRAFRAGAVASLTISIAIGVIWGRSIFRKDHVGFVATHWTASVTSADGCVRIGYGTSPIPASSEGWRFSSEPVTIADARLNEFGQQKDVFVLRSGGTARIYQWWIPWWLGMVITASVPLVYAVKQRVESRRQARAACAVCGYDLRATPKQCPECGNVADAGRPPHNQPLEPDAEDRAAQG